MTYRLARYRVAIYALLVAIGSANSQALAQSAQTQAFTSCLMNCDTKVGLCQGVCNANNSPTTTFAAPIPATRPDPGALIQCNLSCSTQQLTCKQACSIH